MEGLVVTHAAANPDPAFWSGKRVFLTGHTGFKGGWLSVWLNMLGARVTGYALPPTTKPSFFAHAGVQQAIEKSHQANICNYPQLAQAMLAANPEVIFHLAAQPLVRRSYADPLETYQTNVMGTANLLRAARNCSDLEAVVVVTSDKCYENQSWPWGYRETDTLGGHDPYSNSKACQELVVSSFRKSSFTEKGIALATARAGNVIGGGDWSEDRLIPDAIRAHINQQPLVIRNPKATRPWQHVLEPLSGYLVLAEQLATKKSQYADAWNFGPLDADVQTVEEVLGLVSNALPDGLHWQVDSSAHHPHEAQILKLDCAKSTSLLKWRPRWDLAAAVAHTCSWYRHSQRAFDMRSYTQDQITAFTNSVSH
jgi:CDP-glucose 4,6-dehydratase